MSQRILKYTEAIREALDLALAEDPAVYVMGLGVPDPRGVFGTTAGLQRKYGSQRVLDMPTSENGMTGVAIGSALGGLRPVMVHQRLDFALLALEQIVNQAAKWHYMFGGRQAVPLVIRLVTGRGWGQGPQHSQALQSWFAHVPGLKVVMPATAHDAKGLLLAAIADDNPVLFLEHRWLHGLSGEVPEGRYETPIGPARVARAGCDVTIAATSYMTIEALRAAEELAAVGVRAEVIDIRTLRPLQPDEYVESVRKTGHVVIADTGWRAFGIGAEFAALAVEYAWDALKKPPVRLGQVDCPTPTSPALAKYCYSGHHEIFAAACRLLGVPPRSDDPAMSIAHPADVPDPTFTGPF